MILTASQETEKVFLSSRGVFLVRVAIMMFLRIIKVREIGKKKRRVTHRMFQNFKEGIEIIIKCF